MSVRDAAVADIVPKMSETEGYGNTNNPRLVPYNLGHALFEFIEAKWGKEGIRQFMFSLRKSVIGGGEDAYEEAFKMKPDEFDQAFDRYLKERFKPFRDKERPADYGRDLAPEPREDPLRRSVVDRRRRPRATCSRSSPTTARTSELDIVLISSKDGSIVRNLTRGFDKDMGFDHIVYLGERPEMPWMSWSPKGRPARLLRADREGADADHPERADPQDRGAGPDEDGRRARVADFSPDGRKVAFAGAARRRRRHLHDRSRDQGRSPTSRTTTSPTPRRATRRTASS